MKTFTTKAPPRLDVAEVALSLGGQPSLPLAAALADAKLAASRSEARRLVAQGGVTVNGERATDPQAPPAAGEYLVKVGKRHIVRVKVG
jgi:tyrosyl-tRNA synthetase